MERLWKKIDRVEYPPDHLTDQDDCYFARDYVSHGGWQASEANSLITNFKKAISTQGTPQWGYKKKAALQFAQELASILPDRISVAAIPTSRCSEDEDYDPRFDMLFDCLRVRRGDIRVEVPIVRCASSVAAHCGGTRNPAEIVASLAWQGFSGTPLALALIDDVVTSGAHFRACSDLIRSHAPHVGVVGLFWARTVPSSDPF